MNVLADVLFCPMMQIMSKTEEKIRTFVDKNPDMTQAQVAKKLGVSDRTVRRALADKSGQNVRIKQDKKEDKMSGSKADKKADKCPVTDADVMAPDPVVLSIDEQVDKFRKELAASYGINMIKPPPPGTKEFDVWTWRLDGVMRGTQKYHQELMIKAGIAKPDPDKETTSNTNAICEIPLSDGVRQFLDADTAYFEAKRAEDGAQ
jgi:hypothetical protein